MSSCYGLGEALASECTGQGAGPLGPALASGARGFLPCLNSNNSDNPPSSVAADALIERQVSDCLSMSTKRSAAALAWNVQYLADKFGIERIGFFTLTFKQHITCSREAQRRMNNLSRRVLKDRFLEWIRVVERCKSGRIHYHLLVAMKDDIRTGADFDAFQRGDYSSASKSLRSEWAFWRGKAGAAARYGFGRTELLPVKSTSEGIAKYVGKYIGKHMFQRNAQDRGIRLVDYTRGARLASSRFQFVSDGAASWRRKVALFARIVSQLHGVDVSTTADLAETLGSRWAHNNRAFIVQLPDVDADGCFS